MYSNEKQFHEIGGFFKFLILETILGIAILVFILLGVYAVVEASPFLVATKPATGTTEWYQCTGLWFPATDQILPISTGDFKIDMANCPAGTFTVTIKACNVWGCGPDSDPFTFIKGQLPGKVSSTKLTKD